MMTVDDAYRECAARCRIAGLPIDGEPNGAIHRWVAANVRHRPGTAFFIVLGICAAMADMDAQSEGYDSNSHRAAELAWRGRPTRSKR